MAERSYANDVQFAGLVEAATAAAGQEWADTLASRAYHSSNGITNDTVVDQPSRYPSPPGTRKRKRATKSNANSRGQYQAYVETDVAPLQPSSNASHAPVAAALWREPAANDANKHTRPPMVTLYHSLGLSPESFLELQAEAKGFMLDARYPERRDCVGSRGRGELADLMKFRLYKLVEEFMRDRGHGQRFFGRDLPEKPTHGCFWPEDDAEIIKLCIPLFRRMITNEKQRQYATEARKGTKRSKSGGLETNKESVQNGEAYTGSVLDILGDSCTPSIAAAAKWFDFHQNRSQITKTAGELQLDDEFLRCVVANIDGHHMIFHKGKLDNCGFDCYGQRVELLCSWVADHNKAITLSDSVSYTDCLDQVFEISRRNLHEQQQLLAIGPEAPSTIRFQPMAQDPAATAIDGIQSNAGLASSPSHVESHAHVESPGNTILLHVNVISKSSSDVKTAKRVVPRFSLGAESAKSLAQLRGEVEIRCYAVPHHNAGRHTDMDFNVKVWLPDGLVLVKDDGEWMIALLSAGMVDWMDGEVRVLVEV